MKPKMSARKAPQEVSQQISSQSPKKKASPCTGEAF
jgi:hypothetical protein